jgi:tetratricopeptide (TPR) repeat protein
VRVIYTTASKNRQLIFLVILILVICLAFNNLFSQNIQSKPTRQSSLEAFSKGNYDEAYSEFSVLLQTYSKDPTYNYYSGVCLVKLKRSPDKAVTFLKQALQSSSQLKGLPSDALFYLGQAQQMSGSFNEASESYILFTEQAGKRAARDLGVPELIQQCNEKKGAIPKTVTPQTEKVITTKPEQIKIELKPEAKEVVIPPVVAKTSINRDIPGSYDLILGEALKFQFKSDSLTSIVVKQKSELNKIPDSDRASLKVKIAENELLATSFQKSADAKYKEAELAMTPVKVSTSPQNPPAQSSGITVKDSVKQEISLIRKDSVILSGNKAIKKPDNQTDTITKIIPLSYKAVEVFSFFEVLPKPVTDPGVKIDIDPVVPPGLIYRIQIAVFRNPVSPSYFKGITPVYGFKIAGTDKTGYYIGMFRRLSEANKALATVKAKGFKDSFIVALLGNKQVSADRAAVLEKEWGKKPFLSSVESQAETPLDTVPPALSFRVEVIRTSTPVKPDVLEGIEKMAGSRGLDIQPLSDGKFAYLIGNFITFDSAAEYADLLTRNGYREAKVVAWLGKREIPVDTARQLIENVK